MENRGKDTLAWYCGALEPDKAGLSRGDFEALQNGAGISWADVSTFSTYVDGVDAPAKFLVPYRKMRKLPTKDHQFMAFAPRMVNSGSPKTEYEYRITLFALDRDLGDWAPGKWGEHILLSSRPISTIKILLLSTTGGRNLKVLSRFQKILRGNVLGSTELTFRASW